MELGKNKVGRFHYSLSEPDGVEIENSHDGEPVTYLHGHGNVLPALEEALAGKAEGASLTVELPPEKAYGVRREDAIQRVPIKHLSHPGKLRVGTIATVHTDQGHRQVTVVKVGKFNADVDSNHPLAGKALRFDIEIVEVRDASAEEISHGHAHGPGGHHH